MVCTAIKSAVFDRSQAPAVRTGIVSNQPICGQFRLKSPFRPCRTA